MKDHWLPPTPEVLRPWMPTIWFAVMILGIAAAGYFSTLEAMPYTVTITAVVLFAPLMKSIANC